MDRSREFHDRQVSRGEISSDEPKRMVRLGGIPYYLVGIWEAQAERSLTSKQEIVNYSVASGLQSFEDTRKGICRTLSKAKVALIEESTDQQIVAKIFSGNHLPLSDGPGSDRSNFLGFKRKMSCRLGENLIDKIEHYHSILGIDKSKLYCVFSMIYLTSVPRIPDDYKIPMRTDIRGLVDTIEKLHGRVKKLVEEERGSGKKSYEIQGSEDILRGDSH